MKIFKLSQNVWLCKKKQSNGRYAMFLKWTDADRHAHVEYCRDANGHILHIVPPQNKEARSHNSLVLNVCQNLRTLKAAEFISLATLRVPQIVKSSPTLGAFLHTYYEHQQQNGIRSASCTLRLIRIIGMFAPNALLSDAAKTDFVVRLREYLLHTYIINSTQRHLSVNTVVLYLNVLQGALSMAVRRRLICSNPFSHLERSERLHSQPSQRTALNAAEVMRMHRIAPTDVVCLAFVFACLTGLRLSDIRDLRWRHITEQNGVMFVDKTIIKTRRRIAVPLNAQAVSLLERLRGNGATDERIFAMPKSASTISKRLSRVAQAAEVAHKVTFHCARHTFATLIATTSGDINITRQLLGHSNIRTTQIYLHTPAEAMRQAIDRLPQMFDK